MGTGIRKKRSMEKIIALWGFSFILTVFLGLSLMVGPAIAQQEKSIVIGVLFDGSGRAAFYSGQTVMGIEAAVDEINENGELWEGVLPLQSRTMGTTRMSLPCGPVP